MKEAVHVVQRPLISEKSYAAMATGKYLFRVHPKATKTEIAKEGDGTAQSEAAKDQTETPSN